MIELPGLFPIHNVVALHAIRTELAFMDVFVAALAFLGKAHVGLRQVLVLDQRAGGRNHILGRVAFFAGNAGVFVDERVAGQFVVELLDRGLPVNERERQTIVVEVAANAIPAVGILHPESRVIALLHGQAFGDLFVAFEAFKRGRTRSELVARIALRRAAEGVVRSCERTGRNLGAGTGREEQNSSQNKHQAKDPE